jgi:NADH-quinone oxidoreductase subunit H
VTLAFVIIAVGKTIAAFALLMLTTILLVWFERKVLSDMQARIGPNRWGPFGLLQTLADGIKLFFKEGLRPTVADKWTFAIAPVAAMAPALVAFAIIPFGHEVTIAGHRIFFVLTDLNIGILYFLAMGSLGVYGIVLAGWASGSKYPLLGGVRSSAQMISYEISLGLSIIPVVIAAGSLSTVDIIAQQGGTVVSSNAFQGVGALHTVAGWFHFLPNWYIWSQWPAFILFMIAGAAETNRAPFDLPEAESELVAGYHTEYSGIRFALFFLGEYVHMIVVSSLAVTLWFWPFIWFMVKLTIFLYAFVWVRGTLPRLRYDRLMWLGWKRLLPACLAWIVVTAVVNTPDIPRYWRFGVFGLLFLLVVAWIGRGDPRLREAVSPQRRLTTVPTGSRGLDS